MLNFELITKYKTYKINAKCKIHKTNKN